MAIMHEDATCTIFFGDAQHAFIPYRYKGFSVLQKPPFNGLGPSMGLKQLVFLHQIHGTQGKVVTAMDARDQLPSFVHDGDFLICNAPRIGLAVATADCLPVIVVDKVRKVVGIAHAGWRGSVLGVGTELLLRMNQLFKTAPEQVAIFFGPSARVCCYEVQPDFYDNVRLSPYASQVMVEREGKSFFDLGLFNRRQLELAGVPAAAINEQFYACTMCNGQFCSVRRLKNDDRQMTVVTLR